MDEFPYVPPTFLQNQSVDEIHQRMMANLPDDIDKSELQIPWDYTRPTAIEKAEFVEFRLNETIKVIFPQWAYDEYLNLHAEMVGLNRREANRASGNITITGVAGTIIPQGFQFATPAVNSSSILFEALETLVIDSAGTVDMPIQALEGGLIGNVTKDTIILMVKPMKGISSVTNPNPTTGGMAIESDTLLRQRVLEALRKGGSFVGNDSDYIRWAKDVPGVGQAIVIPEWAGAGTVKLILVDANGQPANQQILSAVYNYIVSPDDRINRLAPIGSTLTVAAPTPVIIDVSASIALKEGEILETVKSRFISNLNNYYLAAASQGSVTYVYVGSILAQTAGIADYNNLLVIGDTENIPIALDEFPVTGEVTFRG